MLEYLDFIKKNWKLIACSWEDCDQCLYDNLSEYGYDDFIWCCGFASGFILDIFGVYDWFPQKEREKHFIHKIEDIQLEPGFIYEFEISGHVFCVCHHSDGTLYYIDYYVETGREEPFRLEPMKLSELMEYLTGYVNEDFKIYQKFNQCTSEHTKEAERSYHFDKKRGKTFNKNFHTLNYTKHQITIEPTIESIIKIIIDSGSPIEEIEDYNLESFQKRLTLIEKLKELNKS